jgi:glycosyltransferase involved in cell wall biosynthesis
MSTVSVIVPCYNAAAFLCTTIDSVLDQEMSDWELILVDDGSCDATWHIISRYVRADSRIAGFQNNKNPELGLCKGQFLISLPFFP